MQTTRIATQVIRLYSDNCYIIFSALFVLAENDGPLPGLKHDPDSIRLKH